MAALLSLASSVPAWGLTITEIHYAPPESEPAGRTQFVEVLNDSPTPIDLTGYRFSEGIRFQFPDDFLLPAMGYVVIAADLDAFSARYGIENVLGNFTGNLSNDGDELVLVNEAGVPAARVDFSDSGKWTSVPSGTGYTLSLRSPFADPRRPENWTYSHAIGGTPGAENFPPPQPVDTEIFGENSTWRLLKGWDGAAPLTEFSSPPEAWRQADFDDSTWEEAVTGIGYEDNDDTTVLTDMKDNYISFACRKRFVVEPEIYEQLAAMIFKVKIDDGCIAYLNGEEIGRVNMGAAGTPFAPGDRAVGSTEARSFFEFTVARDRFQPGENVLAVQVHNVSLSSNDASFIPVLAWRKFISFDPPPPPPLRLNEVETATAEGRWLELANISASPLDVSGMHLTDEPGRLDKFEIPGGTVIPPSGFVTFSEAEMGFQLNLPRVRLVVTDRDGESIADARIFSNSTASPIPSSAHARLPDGVGSWYHTLTTTPSAANRVDLERDVVVNEIMYNPIIESERGEYIELFNRSDRTISLEGWRIVEGYDYDFLPGTAIPPGGYLVIGRDPEFLRSTYGLAEDVVLGPQPDPESVARFGRLANSGEDIRIVDGLGNTLTEIRYQEGGEWPELADGGGSSLELIDPWQDPSFGSAWEDSDESLKAPWREYTYRAPYFNTAGSDTYFLQESELWIYLLSSGECLVDDVTVQDDSKREYCNTTTGYIGDFETRTPAWRFQGTHILSGYTDAEAHGGAQALKVVATGPGDNRVNKVEMDTSPRLPAGSAITVHFWARWLKGTRALHTCGFSNAFARTTFLEVPPDLGSPGRENGARKRLLQATGSDNLGPVITAASHSPVVPTVDDDVIITARVSDFDGVESVRAGFLLNNRRSPPEYVELHDDGASSDGAAGDGVYGGKLPPRPLNTKVLFFIEAADRKGAVRTFPASAPDKTLLYQVSAPTSPTSFRFRLVLDEENQRTLDSRLLHSDDLVDGHFIFEESKTYYNVGVRFHGSPWNRPPTPRMFRVKFQGDQEFRGFRRINLSRYGNAPNEGTAYYLIRKASGGEQARTPYSPRYTYVRTTYNGLPHATQAEILAVDGNYADYWWPKDNDGYAYKITGKLDFNDGGARSNIFWTQFRNYGADKEAFRFYFNPSTNRDEDNFEPLMQFLRAFDTSQTPSTALFQERIDSILNVESFLRVMAIRALQDDWDVIGLGNGQNAYLYYAPIEGKFYFLPWDMDHTFGNVGATLLPTADPGMNRLMATPKYRRAYLRILKEYVDTFWNPGPAPGVGTYLDAVGQATLFTGVGSPVQLKSYMTSRIPMVRNLVRSSPATPFAITTNGGRDFAVQTPSVRLTGSAPLEVTRFLVNGEEMEPVWSGNNMTTWTLDLATEPGKNRFEFIGFNRRDEPETPQVSITIYNSAGWPAPELRSIDPERGPARGGIEVTLRGQGFQEGFRVLFGETESPSVTLVSAEEARAVVPADPAPAAGGRKVDVKAVNIDNQAGTLPAAFAYDEPGVMFLRGDAERDGRVDASDAVAILSFLFLDGALSCMDAADVDDSGAVNITDPIVILLHLFRGGPAPPAPFPEPGEDPTPGDGLGCQE